VKHGVRFDQAATVFLDPRAISIFDTDHSDDEDRWMTLGISATAGLLVVNHTFVATDDRTATIRIISSRKATKREAEQYAEVKS
jgi:hypothetical protein